MTYYAHGNTIIFKKINITIISQIFLMPLFSIIHDEKQNSKMAKGSYGWIVGAYWLMVLIMEWLGSDYISYLLLNNKLPLNKHLKTTNIHHFSFSRSGILAWPLDQGLSKGWWSRCWQRLQTSQSSNWGGSTFKLIHVMVGEPHSLLLLVSCHSKLLLGQHDRWFPSELLSESL